MVLAVEILNFTTKSVSMPQTYSSINDRNLNKKRTLFSQKFSDISFFTCFVKKKKYYIFRNLFMKKGKLC